MIDFETLRHLSGGRPQWDVACPSCSPGRKSRHNRTRKVLRIWDNGDDFITFKCSRCAEAGYAKPEGSARLAPRPRPQPVKSEPAPDKSELARFLLSNRKPIAGSIAERYLRGPRGYLGPLPSTLSFLPARGDHPPAMIAAFGIPAEPEPGCLVVDNSIVTGLHLTKLRPDGSGKADVDSPKIMIGPSVGQPIVLAPPNDLLGLAITEGIEDALTVHELTGLGAWAAGSASRLAALADVVPGYVECASVFVDADDAGRRNAAELVARLKERGIYAEPLELGAAHA
jgi:Toprim domain